MDVNKSVVKSEHCPECHNDTFKNHFVLEKGHHARVFVECTKCGHFVARYILHAYVDPEYSFSSALSMIANSTTYGDSVENISEEIALHQKRAKTQFDQVKEEIKTKKHVVEDKKIIELIHDHGILDDM